MWGPAYWEHSEQSPNLLDQMVLTSFQSFFWTSGGARSGQLGGRPIESILNSHPICWIRWFWPGFRETSGCAPDSCARSEFQLWVRPIERILIWKHCTLISHLIYCIRWYWPNFSQSNFWCTPSVACARSAPNCGDRPQIWCERVQSDRETFPQHQFRFPDTINQFRLSSLIPFKAQFWTKVTILKKSNLFTNLTWRDREILPHFYAPDTISSNFETFVTPKTSDKFYLIIYMKLFETLTDVFDFVQDIIIGNWKVII